MSVPSSRRIQFQRGTTVQNAAFEGLVGELTVDTDKRAVVLHDGTGGLTTMVTESTTQTLENKTLSLDDNLFPGIDGSGLEVVQGELQVDGTVVRTSGNQTISGFKTFTNAVAVNTPGGITTNQTTISLFNGSADTINFGANATNVQIASNTGTTSINNNLFVSGDFTVDGTFVTVDQENLSITNKNIFLGETGEPSDPLADGGGIVLRGDEDKSLLWIQSTDAWTSSENFDLAENKSYLVNSTEVLTETSLGNSVVSSSLESVGTITSGTWNGDVISSEHGGTGQSTYTDGQLLIGNTSDDTLNKSTLDGGLGININNGSGEIEIINSDRGSAQSIFKNISDQNGIVQFTADSNSDSIRFEGTGGTEITFDSETNSILIGSGEAAGLLTPDDGIEISEEGEISVDNTVVRTFGEQTIGDTKTFSVPIDGDISGNAASASRLEPGAFINGVFFDGTQNVNLAAAALEESLIAGDGIGSTGPFDGTVERTFTNTDKGSDQDIFKNVQNENGVTQFFANDNADILRFAAGGDLSIEFDTSTNQIKYSLEVAEAAAFTAGDGLDLENDEFSVDNTVVRTTNINQAIGGTKTFINALELGAQGTTLGQAIRGEREIATGDGLTGGGTLTQDRTIEVDGTVVRTGGEQTIGGTKSFVNTIIATSASPGLFINSIASSTAEFDLVNTQVSTINFGGDASVVNIGSDSSVINLGGDLDIGEGKEYQINGTTVLTGSTLGSSIIESSLESVSTISTGTWNASTIQPEFGGTGKTTYNEGELLIGNTAGSLDRATLTPGTNIGIDNGDGSITINGPDFTAGDGIIRSGFEFSVNAGDGLVQESNGLSVDFSRVADADTILTGGDGIGSIGDLSDNRTISVDNTVLRTTGGQTLDGSIIIDGDARIKSLGVGVSASGVEGEIRSTDQITAFAASDERLKENIKNIPDALVSVLTLRGVEFDWTDEEVNRRGGEDDMFVRRHSVGVIAQDVEKILPEAVAERPDGYKAVRYELLVPLLIEAMNEQQSEIEMLKNKVEELCRRL